MKYMLPILIAIAPLQISAEETPEWSVESVQPLFARYCSRCHNEKKYEGEFSLSSYDTRESYLQDRKQWQQVLRVLKEEEMPPEDPLPSAADRKKLIDWVDLTINRIDWSKHRHAGHVTIPRLTRDEYNNTMRDLLGIDLKPGNLFSEDGQGESGFNNDRDALFLTPALLEKYLMAADRALESVMALEQSPRTIHLESEKMFMTETREAPQDFGDGFTGYVINRGQMTLYDSVPFPFDGIYEFKIRARSTAGPTGTRLRINDRTMADIVVSASEPAEYVVTSFIAKGSHQMTWNIQRPRQADRQRPPPVPKSGYTKLPPNANQIITRESSKTAPVFALKGELKQSVQQKIDRVNSVSVSVQRPIEWLRLHGPSGDPSEILRFKGYIQERTATLETAKNELAQALNLTREEFDSRFESQNREKLADNQKVQNAVAKVVAAATQRNLKPGNVAIDWIEVRGPLAPPTVSGNILKLRPLKGLTKESSAEIQISDFAARAFRRPVSQLEVERLLGLYRRGVERGGSHESSLKLALTAVLVSPNFLFRHEQGEGEFAVNDFQLASRLSYFLWISMPDEELFRLAENGTLHQPEILLAQVERMLNDSKSRAFTENFLGQWLGFALLGESVIPDEKLFPQFDDELNQAMKMETVLCFEQLLRSGGSILQLIDSRETYLNQRLAAHYGIKGVSGPAMQGVVLEDPARGGLLGMGSVLTATSSPTRTSPVLRGKWVLETLLGEPAGDPPPDAGALPGNAGQQEGLTLREEFLEHRRNATCAACHDKIDPLGFGLENFDAIGRFRDRENGKPIDATGTLPDGTSFDGPAELKQYLLANRQDQFLENISERLLSFALGRRLHYYDQPAIDRISLAVRNDRYSATRLIQEVVQSYPFLHQAPQAEVDTTQSSSR